MRVSPDSYSGAVFYILDCDLLFRMARSEPAKSSTMPSFDLHQHFLWISSIAWGFSNDNNSDHHYHDKHSNDSPFSERVSGGKQQICSSIRDHIYT